MTCPCINPAPDRWSLWRQTAKAVLGIPDYDAYLTHMAENHPHGTPMSRTAFFTAKQKARYGSIALRCC